MKNLFLAVAFIVSLGYAQNETKYKTSTGSISFFSSTTLEDIKANNNQVTALLSSSGAVAVIVSIKSFEFDKSLMQTHFNENYMESDKFPKSTFDGKITNMADVKLNTNGTYSVTVAGKLTIHGVTKEVSEKGTVEVSGTNITIKAKFKVKLPDYNIKNDKTNNISNEIEVTVNCKLAKV